MFELTFSDGHVDDYHQGITLFDIAALVRKHGQIVNIRRIAIVP